MIARILNMFSSAKKHKWSYIKIIIVPVFLVTSILEIWEYSNDIWQTAKAITLLLFAFSYVLGDGETRKLVGLYISKKYSSNKPTTTRIE